MTSAEQKADAVTRECVESLCVGCMESSPCASPSNENCACFRAMYDAIRDALREAGNAKLEEALEVVTAARDRLESAAKGDAQFQQVSTLIVGFADAFIADIRSLISKKD